MSVLKIGDTVRRLHDRHLGINVGEVAVVTDLNVRGTNVRLNGNQEGSHKLTNLLLVEAVKPTHEATPSYPNPPHKHAELIKAWADGAEIQYQYASSPQGSSWCDERNPSWNPRCPYRIKPTKSAKDVKLEELEAKALELAKEIKELRDV